jgi:hypothetical protein
MTRPKKKAREFWIVESEYGMDFKRYVVSAHRSEAEARSFAKYLDIKNPHDKHEVYPVREIIVKAGKGRGKV